MSINEKTRQYPTGSQGEPIARITPAQVRNYRDALVALGVDEATAQSRSELLTKTSVNPIGVRAAVTVVFGNGNAMHERRLVPVEERVR
ncbi:MAG: hypothetical protein AAB702_02580 [Patescibacteria group bacterium]